MSTSITALTLTPLTALTLRFPPGRVAVADLLVLLHALGCTRAVDDARGAGPLGRPLDVVSVPAITPGALRDLTLSTARQDVLVERLREMQVFVPPSWGDEEPRRAPPMPAFARVERGAHYTTVSRDLYLALNGFVARRYGAGTSDSNTVFTVALSDLRGLSLTTLMVLIRYLGVRAVGSDRAAVIARGLYDVGVSGNRVVLDFDVDGNLLWALGRPMAAVRFGGDGAGLKTTDGVLRPFSNAEVGRVIRQTARELETVGVKMSYGRRPVYGEPRWTMTLSGGKKSLLASAWTEASLEAAKADFRPTPFTIHNETTLPTARTRREESTRLSRVEPRMLIARPQPLKRPIARVVAPGSGEAERLNALAAAKRARDEDRAKARYEKMISRCYQSALFAQRVKPHYDDATRRRLAEHIVFHKSLKQNPPLIPLTSEEEAEALRISQRTRARHRALHSFDATIDTPPVTPPPGARRRDPVRDFEAAALAAEFAWVNASGFTGED